MLDPTGFMAYAAQLVARVVERIEEAVSSNMTRKWRLKRDNV